MQIVFVVLAEAMIACWLALAVLGPRRMDTANAIAVLRYSVLMRMLALMIALTPLLIFFYAMRNFHWETPAKFNTGGFAFLTFSAIVGLWLIEVTRVQIVLTEDGITRSSPWSGLATLKWSDVQRVGYSSINRWFSVEGAGQTIRVSQYLGGIGTFADIVERKVTANRWASAARSLGSVK